MQRQSQKGFTLVELMVVMTLVGIVAAVAVPGFSKLIQDSRISAQSNDFLGALRHARSEAIKRGNNVSMCSSSDPSADPPACNVNAEWNDGWLMWDDANEDGVLDNGEEILSAGGVMAGSNTVIELDINGAKTPVRQFEFLSRGLSTEQVAFMICDERDQSNAVLLYLTGTAKTSDTNLTGGDLDCTI